jgi:threonine aldolase
VSAPFNEIVRIRPFLNICSAMLAAVTRGRISTRIRSCLEPRLESGISSYRVNKPPKSISTTQYRKMGSSTPQDGADSLPDLKHNPAIAAANEQASTHQKINAWQQPGPSAFDFRSDTITTPNASMLNAITNTTLMDDVFVEDSTTNDLESHIAKLTGHEAGLLVMSGTMGNQVALRTHLAQPPYSVLCDIRGHVYNYEAGGVSSLSSAMLIAVQPENNHHLTLEDVEARAIISTDVHACPTKVISLENTLNGMIMPLSEVQRIAAFAREHRIKLHLDGARIWEAAAANAGSLTDFCSLFDSVSMCFSKGLGAPIGSLIVGNADFITRARHIRKMLGGGTRQSGVISAAARVAVDENFGQGPHGEGGKLRACHARAKRIAETWESKGGKLAHPTETNMVWLDLAHQGVSAAEFAQIAAEEGLKALSGRLVVHYQIADEAEEKLAKAMVKVIQRGKQNGASGANGGAVSNGDDRYGSKKRKTVE